MEGVEDVVKILWIDAGAVILHLHSDPTGVIGRKGIGPDDDDTVTIDGLIGVRDQVEEGLFQLLIISGYPGKIFRILPDEMDVVP